MATAPSTPPALREIGLPGTRFECSVEILDNGETTPTPAEHPPLLPDPMTLRIFFDPVRAHALFRLQAMIPLASESGGEGVTSHPFHLQLRLEHIHSLRLDDSDLHLHLASPDAISLIGPASIPTGCLRPTTPALRAMALLSRQRSIVIRLSPPRARQHAHSLAAFCEAVSTAGTQLHADPAQLDLRGLYRGTGGRFVAPEEILNASVDDVPPSYTDVAPPSAPISPGPSTRKTKRLRTRSPSDSESETRSKQALVPDRANVLAELIPQLDDREKGIRALLEEMDTKNARATSQMQQMDEQAQRLTELTAAAAAAAAAAASSGPKVSPSTPSHPRPTQVPRSSPSPSTASSSASKISTRIQAYIETQLEIVREEMRAHNEEYVDNTVANHATTEEMQTYVDNSLSDYATIEAMESHVNDELDGALSDHVEDFQMYEAITEAVDNAIEGIRERVMAAWDR